MVDCAGLVIPSDLGTLFKLIKTPLHSGPIHSLPHDRGEGCPKKVKVAVDAPQNRMNKEVLASINEQGDVVRARKDGATINVIDGVGAGGLEGNDTNLGVEPAKGSDAVVPQPIGRTGLQCADPV